MNAIIINELIEGLRRGAFGGEPDIDGWISGLDPHIKKEIVRLLDKLLDKMKPKAGRPPSK